MFSFDGGDRRTENAFTVFLAYIVNAMKLQTFDESTLDLLKSNIDENIFFHASHNFVQELKHFKVLNFTLLHGIGSKPRESWHNLIDSPPAFCT